MRKFPNLRYLIMDKSIGLVTDRLSFTVMTLKSWQLTVHETMMEELSSPSSTAALTFSGRKGAGGRAETEGEKNQKCLIERC